MLHLGSQTPQNERFLSPLGAQVAQKGDQNCRKWLGRVGQKGKGSKSWAGRLDLSVGAMETIGNQAGIRQGQRQKLSKRQVI